MAGQIYDQYTGSGIMERKDASDFTIQLKNDQDVSEPVDTVVMF